jgi:hypothetical protein
MTKTISAVAFALVCATACGPGERDILPGVPPGNTNPNNPNNPNQPGSDGGQHSGSDGGSNGGSDGGTTTPTGWKNGAVWAQSQVFTAAGMQYPSWSAGAYFYSSDETGVSTCTQKDEGPCVVTTCQPTGAQNPTYDELSAGGITISGGAQSVTLAAPPGDGAYEAKSGTGTVLWHGGEQLKFQASGAAVPAFSASVTAPSAPVVSSPPLPSPGQALHFGKNGQTFSWSGGAAGKFIVILAGQAQQGAVTTSVRCAFSAAAGTGTVPAGAIAAIPQSSGSFMVMVENESIVTAGEWPVSLRLTTVANTPNGSYFSGVASFE